jgi:hypothetical protein
MSDTAPVIEKRYREMLMRLPPEQRLLQTCRMFATAKRLAEGAIRATSAGPMDDETLGRELFLRLYGEKFAIHSEKWSSRDTSLSDHIVTRPQGKQEDSRVLEGTWARSRVACL